MEHGDSPPYWQWQPPATLTHRNLRRQRPSSPFLNSSVFIILVPSVTVLFIVVSLPYFLHSTPQTPKPNNFSPNPKPPNSSVKKSWDSLNIVLVLLAILCGIFAKRNDDSSSSQSSTTNETHSSIRNASSTELLQQRQPPQYSVVSSQNWYECTESEEQKIYAPPPLAIGITHPLRRSFSSYPDLRKQEAAWESMSTDQLRFFDDFELNKFHQLPSDKCVQLEEASAKDIPVDTSVVQSKLQEDLPSITLTPQLPPQSPATLPTPSLPPPPPVSHEPKRPYQGIPSGERVVKSPPPPVPSPTQPERREVRGAEEKRKRSSRRKNNATREIASAIASLYGQGNRKRKQRQFKQNSALGTDESQSSQHIPPLSPPSPPPPTAFHQLLRKGSRGKKIHSVPSSATPPPPPPPPPEPTARLRMSMSQISSHQNSSQKDPISEAPRRRASFHTGKPPLPVRSSNYYERDENLRNRSRSRPITTPTPPRPPPPPPSLQSPEMKFVMQGDCVRVQSAHGSPSAFPRIDDVVTSDDRNRGDGNGPPVTCPSPDVNVKADSFIARLHDGWRLEKLSSYRDKQKVGQNIWS